MTSWIGCAIPLRLVPVEYWKPARVKSWAVPGVVGVKVGAALIACWVALRL